ncbi:MAG TPA: adenylate/guanylate cyclase domain-containing protein [Nevskiaceae bacterium]|nr:adenylate/guanylate cyclase domain-containing protein [Nevskiaceae bacterium]
MSGCPVCGADNPPQARFCNQCGSRLQQGPATYTPAHLAEKVLRERAALIGERKRVTVLFADVKASTRLATLLGAEVWHGVLDRLFALLSGAVHRFEGTVNQYTGDGIMALFGAPLAHEDHAARAARAALAIQEAVAVLAQDVEQRHGQRLRLRIGLNTGEVIVGRIGDDLRMDYTAQGLTVNLAARLEQHCPPGEIALSRYTARLIEDEFLLAAEGEQLLPGLEQPVGVYRLLGWRGETAPTEPPTSAATTPLLGREAESALLASLWQRARSGDGQALVLTGAAGIGKTRLCREFLAPLAVPVWSASGHPYAGAPPLAIGQTLLRARLGVPPGSGPERVRRAVREQLGPALPHAEARAFVEEFLGVADGPGLAPDQVAGLRAPMLQRLVQELVEGERPRVIWVDDLQWIDDTSQEFLLRLAAAVAGRHCLLLLSGREGERLDALRRAGRRVLELAPLEEPVLEALAAVQLGEDPDLADLALRIAQRAAGNPFFVEEAIAALAEAGHLQGAAAAWRLTRPIEQWPIADSVHDLIAARIDRLPSRQKVLLQAAAVAGADFDATWLADEEAGSDWVDDQLGALVRHGLIAEVQGRHRFAQPLVREVAYGMQLESQRQDRHRRLARRLAAALGRPVPHPDAARIAHHLACAGDALEAAPWNLAAARWWAGRDLRITLDHFQQVIRHLDPQPATPAVDALAVMARAGVIRMAQFFHIAESEVECRYREARERAERLGDPTVLGELMISYGNEQLHRGDARQALQLSREALALAARHRLQDLVVRFRLPLLMNFATTGVLSEGLAAIDAVVGSHWREGAIDDDNCLSRAFMALSDLWRGDLQRARRELDATLVVADREARGASWIVANRVEWAWFAGRSQGVVALAENALERARAFGSDYFHALALRSLGLAYRLEQRPQAALAPLLEARALTARGQLAHPFEPTVLASLALALLALDRTEEAAAHAREAVQSAERMGAPLWEISARLAQLALPAEVLGAEETEAALQRLEGLIHALGAEGYRPWLEQARARLHPDPAVRAAAAAAAPVALARLRGSIES